MYKKQVRNKCSPGKTKMTKLESSDHSGCGMVAIQYGEHCDLHFFPIAVRFSTCSLYFVSSSDQWLLAQFFPHSKYHWQYHLWYSENFLFKQIKTQISIRFLHGFPLKPTFILYTIMLLGVVGNKNEFPVEFFYKQIDITLVNNRWMVLFTLNISPFRNLRR